MATPDGWQAIFRYFLTSDALATALRADLQNLPTKKWLRR